MSSAPALPIPPYPWRRQTTKSESVRCPGPEADERRDKILSYLRERNERDLDSDDSWQAVDRLDWRPY